MRVRGLKLISLFDRLKTCKSHPVRVRGLKQHPDIGKIAANMVAPRAGAWIETRHSLPRFSFFVIVAPRAGAWIETPAR